MWSFISFAAFGTLPEPLKQMYGVEWGPVRQRCLDANLTCLGRARPHLPERLRLIGPAQIANRRLSGDTSIRIVDTMRAAARAQR